MKLILFGAGNFGLPCLRALDQSHHEVLGIVTTPDKPQGRGKHIQASPLKSLAQELSAPVIPIEKVNQEASLQTLASYSADVFCVVSFGTLLSNRFLALPKHGCVNVHPSLLPKYRGASPIAQALMDGEETVGTSTMRVSEEMDAGDVLLQDSIQLKGDENAEEVWNTLADLSAPLLVKTLDLLEKGKLNETPQDASQATYCSKLDKTHAVIDWSLSAEEIHNRVRGLYLWPGTATHLKAKSLKILKTKKAQESSDEIPGTVIQIDKHEGIRVSTGGGTLWIQRLQLEGKPAMTAQSFLNGHPIEVGERLESP